MSSSKAPSSELSCPVCGRSGFDGKAGLQTHRAMQHSVPWEDKGTVEELYVEKEMTVPELADRWGCSKITVSRALDRHGIETRDRSETVTPADLRDSEYLRSLYHSQGMSTYQIAEEIGCTPRSVGHWLQRHGIERNDSMDDSHPYYAASGEDHPNWRGGIDYFGSNWYKKRREALKRDQYRCQDCGLTDAEHRHQYDRSLEVHHLKPRREFVTEDGELNHEAANRLSNLVTLCIPCHKEWEEKSRE